MGSKRQVTIFQGEAKKRIDYGLDRVQSALKRHGFAVSFEPLPESPAAYRNTPGQKLLCGVRGEGALMRWLEETELLYFHHEVPEGEGFYLQSVPSELVVVCGGSDSGALYGCLELIRLIEQHGAIPFELSLFDKPAFKLRGPCVGLQKTKLEPPRHTYEYPITPERFPWFYDKSLWAEFLEMMLQERCNVLYIWSGHPFSSLVKLEDYPEALEVHEEDYKLNRELFGWLTEECDRRGIWVVLKFYNIHISYPFAQKHGLDTLQSSIHPLVQDYTRKSIIQFIKDFPNIGLMVCLGEALRGNQNKTDWFVNTIVPAVKQGALEARVDKEPPLILRGHDCDPDAAMAGAMPQYSNLYTMWKYNGESLTTIYPTGKWKEQHQRLSAIGTTHIMNVHILANLEPFRFNAPSYIQKCVQAGRFCLGANGLHLYPLFYWDWPYAPDRTKERLLQMRRDWIWFAAWFRYAWNPDHSQQNEQLFWRERIAKHYGISLDASSDLLDIMEAAAVCAPKLLGRVGITEGNRQTMSLGMLMSQLTNAAKYRPNTELWKSVARAGERPDQYWEKEIQGLAHVGETPYDLVYELQEILRYLRGRKPGAQYKTGLDNQEIVAIYTDIDAIILMIDSYCEKILASMHILHYKHTMNRQCKGDITLLEAALPHLEKSLDLYRQLAALTSGTYLYANSMQTPQRKIPMPNGETYGHWQQCLPIYEDELKAFRHNLKRLKDGWLPKEKVDSANASRLPEAPIELLGGSPAERYTVTFGERLFTDADYSIQLCAKDIDGLTGIRFSMGEAIMTGIRIKFLVREDVRLLIAYLNSKGVEWLQVPDLETNTHADDRGGLSVVFANALKAKGLDTMNVHLFKYEKGTHELYLGTGCFAILGAIPAKADVQPRNAGLEGEGLEALDWLYELPGGNDEY